MPPDDWLSRLLDLAEREVADAHDLTPYGGAVLAHFRRHEAVLRAWGPTKLAAVLHAYVHRSPVAAWHLLMEQVDLVGDPPDLRAAERIAAERAAILDGLLRLVDGMAFRSLHSLILRATGDA